MYDERLNDKMKDTKPEVAASAVERLVMLFKRCWWYNRSTKIRLWHVETIGYYEGYFECKNEQHEYTMQWYGDLKNMTTPEASKLLNARCAKVMRKYFGPKWVKA